MCVTFQFLLCHLFSILQDIILLGLYEPRGYDGYEHEGVPGKILFYSIGNIGLVKQNL